MQPLDLLLEALGVVPVEPVGNEHHDGALAKHAARPMAVEGVQAGADAGAAFGAGASGTVFGARGSGSFFSRATAVCATAFFVTSLSLAYLSSQNSSVPSSLVDDAPVTEEVVEAPVSDMPAIEQEGDLADDATDMPALEDVGVEEEAATDDQ